MSKHLIKLGLTYFEAQAVFHALMFVKVDGWDRDAALARTLAKRKLRIGLDAYNAAGPPDGLDLDALRSDLMKLAGDPPYDGPENPCRNDGYFARSLEAKYGADMKTLTGWAGRKAGDE